MSLQRIVAITLKRDEQLWLDGPDGPGLRLAPEELPPVGYSHRHRVSAGLAPATVYRPGTRGRHSHKFRLIVIAPPGVRVRRSRIKPRKEAS